MIYIKSKEDISNLRIGGKFSAKIMNDALNMAIPGVSTLEINNSIEEHMRKLSVSPWFKEIDKYPYATCIAVNDVWVHGMPSSYILKAGDVISIDLGVKYGKYYLDHCWTVIVPGAKVDPDVARFIETGEKALNLAIKGFVSGSRVGNISNAMQTAVQNAGYSVIREYTGHGVGLKAHEDPLIPCYGTKGAGQLLKIGMVFAIEVMYAIKDPKIVVGRDGWTVSTKDGKLSGMFEHTVALTEDGPEILTI